MQKLTTPYRSSPSAMKCYYQDGNTSFFHAPHQKNLYMRHCAPDAAGLLSVLLICRTLALPGDWHRKINPDYLGITWIHSGETLVRINDESFVAEAGDLFLLPPGSDYEFGTRTEAVRSGIIVQGSVVEAVLMNLRGKNIFSGIEAKFAEEKMERFFTGKDAGEHQLSLWSFDLLAMLKNNKSVSPLPQELQKAVQKIKKHPEMPLSLESLSREAGVSSRTLTRLFQKHLQMPPHRYLIRERMQRACAMLEFGELSIKEIAITVGYPDVLNFSTGFRQFFGCSPSEYRLRKSRNAIFPTELHLD